MSQNLNPTEVEEYLINLTEAEFAQMMNRVTIHRAAEATPVERPEWEVLAEKIARKEAELREWASYDPQTRHEADLANAEYDRLSLEVVELEERYRLLTR